MPGRKNHCFASGITLSLLKDSPYVDHIWETPNQLRPLSAFLYAGLKIWPNRKEYDAIVLNSSNSRTLIALFAILTGIKSALVTACGLGFAYLRWRKRQSSIVETNNNAFRILH